MLTSGISNTYWCRSVGEPCNFMDSFYVLILVLAGVIAMVWGNLVLLADAIAMLPLCLKLMFLF